MIDKSEWRWAISWALVLALLVSLPYLIAWIATPDGLVYTGFLSNPTDGHTYLAKMRQGLDGAWLVRLPYTAEPHRAEFLLTYYLFLGHVARWTHLPLILVYHLARAINSVALLIALYYAISQFTDIFESRKTAFWLAALGSGFGWLAGLLGGLTADLWVPEGYVLYSMWVNPHFPLAIALTLLLVAWSVTPWEARTPAWSQIVRLAAATALLSIAQPFCLIPLGAALALYALVRWVQDRQLPWPLIVSGAAIGLTGLPFAVNAYLASTRNATFAAWSAQNQTPSPPLWNLLLSYGPLLILALPGAWIASKRRRSSNVFLLIWTLSTFFLLYLPFNLQRRLMVGLSVPLGILAAVGYEALAGKLRLPNKVHLPRLAVYAAIGLTQIFVIAISLLSALGGHPELYFTQDEWAALRWIDAQTAPDALIVAAPQSGLYIPAWTGRRVFYGHPFETARADQRMAQVLAFFQQGDRSLLQESPNYAFVGPRERALNPGWQPDPGWTVVFEQDTVTLYALGATP
ncbi:MAG: hypothetical protein JW934_17315 [Anaerolineae bacterium]|nr:hypothetical protein [Anaerolineae bacterium]